MEKLIIEGIYNKDDSYREQLTSDNKLAIGNFFKEHKTEFKEQNIDFLVSEQFLHSVESNIYMVIQVTY